MELLYLYVHNDNKSIKGCEYNFSPNYKFTYNATTKTFHMEWHKNNVPNKWFGDNILNITAIIGKNASGKTNLLECIIKSLCGQGGGWIICLYEGQLYSNVPTLYSEIKFLFEVKRFNRWGSPLNGEFEERINNTEVIFYSTSIDRALSNKNSYYSKFKDISNAFLLRKHIYEIGNTPDFAHISDIDVMQTGDVFRLLLFLIYTRDGSQNIISSFKLPTYIELTFHAYNHSNLDHPTYKELSKGLTDSFQDQIKLKIIQRIFALASIPDAWNNTTSFEEVISVLNTRAEYGYNIYDLLLDLFHRKAIRYKQPLRRASMGGDAPLTFGVYIDFIDYGFVNALYNYYYAIPKVLPYASNRSFDKNASNTWVTIKYGVSSGERILYTLLARILGSIFEKQGEIHYVHERRIVNSHYFDGKTIILLLDEPDLQLHPEWQQKFLNILLSSFAKFFPKVMFQIIITSHSPILISDIPRSNILFIEKRDGYSRVCTSIRHKETFAANIHTLYNDSFFLEGVPIGDFAKCKIQEIYNRLNNAEISPEILKEIYRIGEPIIRGLLLKVYDSKRQNLAPNVRKQYLIEELKKIEDSEKENI